MTSLKNILFPTDFSEYSDYARPYVMELAKKFGARVTLFHAMVSPPDPAYYEMATGREEISGLLREQAHKRIEELAKAFEKEGIEVDREIRTGPAFVEIVAAARRREIDLIIIATHGWGIVKQLLLGSTAERVVRTAPCPVLAIRHPEHEFVHLDPRPGPLNIDEDAEADQVCSHADIT